MTFCGKALRNCCQRRGDMPALAGLRIVVTRASHQAGQLADMLRELGAEVLLVPLIDIGPPADANPLQEAARHCDQYDWVIFTSANAVRAFVKELLQPRTAFHTKFAAVGSSTREEAEKNGVPIALVPREYVAEALLESFAKEKLSGVRILIPAAAVTRNVVPEALRKMGAQVDVVEAYRNVVPAGARERLQEVLREPFPDWITFASPSAVDNAVRLAGPELLRRMRIASIGPVTSEAIRKHGLAVAAQASPQTAAGLAAAIAMYPSAGFEAN
jgi:uroporphyrinogen III methyltransferase/synthase